MADLQDSVTVDNEWFDLSTEYALAVGTTYSVQNQGSNKVYLRADSSTPADDKLGPFIDNPDVPAIVTLTGSDRLYARTDGAATSINVSLG